MIFIGNSTLSGRSSKKPSLEIYPRKRARHAILKYGNACVLSSGGGSAQVKTWWKPPLTRWRKFEKKLRLPFFRLKSWKGCYSRSRWTFFLERFSMKKNAPRCDEILIFIIFVGRQRFRRDLYPSSIVILVGSLHRFRYRDLRQMPQVCWWLPVEEVTILVALMTRAIVTDQAQDAFEMARDRMVPRTGWTLILLRWGHLCSLCKYNFGQCTVHWLRLNGFCEFFDRAIFAQKMIFNICYIWCIYIYMCVYYISDLCRY